MSARWGMAVNFLEGQGDIFERGKVGKQVESLENDADRATIAKQGGFLEVERVAVQLNAAGVRRFQPSQYSQ